MAHFAMASTPPAAATGGTPDEDNYDDDDFEASFSEVPSSPPPTLEGEEDVGLDDERTGFRVAAIEADCEELHDMLNRSELEHQDLMSRYQTLQSSARKLSSENDALRDARAQLEDEVAGLKDGRNEAVEGLESQLVQCKVEVATARGATLTYCRVACARVCVCV